MAIFDCFQYFNEDHMLDLRFNILNERVDHFIVSESTKTHPNQQNRSKYTFPKFLFSRKITFLNIFVCYDNKQIWKTRKSGSYQPSKFVPISESAFGFVAGVAIVLSGLAEITRSSRGVASSDAAAASAPVASSARTK